jgi:hypothetical protein
MEFVFLSGSESPDSTQHRQIRTPMEVARASPNVSPNVFWDANQYVRICVLMGVAWGQMWKPGPASPATVAAWPPVGGFRVRVWRGQWPAGGDTVD